jgi:5-methylcytosine-specific restriction endonuclease McrA
MRRFSDIINGKAPNVGILDPAIQSRLRASNVVSPHGTDGRVLQYHIWDRAQPDIFDKKHFKYEVQHDPIARYSGTATTNFCIQFYMNKIRGVVHDRDAVISRVRAELSRLNIGGFALQENVQAIFLIHRFHADSAVRLDAELRTYLFPLLNEVHPLFYKIMDAFNIPISKEQRRAMIENRTNPSVVDRSSPLYGRNPEHNRNPSAALRAEVFKRDKYTCQHCGVIGTSTSLHADHIVPFGRHGGLTTLKNLQTLCGPCNYRKGARLEAELTYLSRQNA